MTHRILALSLPLDGHESLLLHMILLLLCAVLLCYAVPNLVAHFTWNRQKRRAQAALDSIAKAMSAQAEIQGKENERQLRELRMMRSGVDDLVRICPDLSDVILDDHRQNIGPPRQVERDAVNMALLRLGWGEAERRVKPWSAAASAAPAAEPPPPSPL